MDDHRRRIAPAAHTEHALSEVQHAHSHSHKSTRAVLNRLSKVIGHLTAVKHMVEDGRDCSEVLIQLAAVRSAITGISKIMIRDHIDHCMVDAVEARNMEAINELNKAIERMLK